MKTLLLLMLVLLPTVAAAECSDVVMIPCYDAVNQIRQQFWLERAMDPHDFSPPPPVRALEKVDRYMPEPSVPRSALSNDWTYLRTPQGQTYTNYGTIIQGPDGLYVPY